ncbi:MAG: hypothetical protein K0Q53_587 [Massilibacillus sp.]|jgi:uncharacterized membrane protein YcaP (DUF421 family)|nr:hypothetical protein [Massilibacillus sp.]
MDFQEIFRDTWQTGLVFVSLLIFTRFLGKTQVGQLTFYEYISGITIGSIAANIAASDPDKVWSHFYDLVLFVILTYVFSYLSIKNRSIRKIIEGEATIVIENGTILKENMKGLRYDLDELNAQLREQGVLDISEVQFAILETTGGLSVIKKTLEQPVSKTDMGLKMAEATFPVELIMDGELLHEHLTKNNLSLTWLENELAKQGIKNKAEVLYAVIDSKGKLFVNKIVNQ